MRRLFPALASLCVLTSTAVPASAQTYGSELQTLRQTISGTTVEIAYHRPSVRGRVPVFGGLVHWGEVWTPGANDATQLEVSKDFELGEIEIPAGAYTMWLQPLQDADWQLMLHADTSLYHAPHPTLDEAAFLMRVRPRASGGFVETLTWDVQNVRAASADLVLRWGDTEVSLPLGIDPGYTITVEPEVASSYVGSWILDQSMSAPTEEEMAEMRAEVSEFPGFTEEDWVEFMEFMEQSRVPGPVELTYDPETQRLELVHPMYGPSVLLPKADGIFVEGGLENGEVMYASGSFWEFVMDDAGQAISFEVRDPETDELESKGCRIVAAGAC